MAAALGASLGLHALALEAVQRLPGDPGAPLAAAPREVALVESTALRGAPAASSDRPAPLPAPEGTTDPALTAPSAALAAHRAPKAPRHGRPVTRPQTEAPAARARIEPPPPAVTPTATGAADAADGAAPGDSAWAAAAVAGAVASEAAEAAAAPPAASASSSSSSPGVAQVGGAGRGGSRGAEAVAGTGGGDGFPSSATDEAARLRAIARKLDASATPCYPRSAQRRGREGVAEMRFCIDPMGAPRASAAARWC